MPQKDVEVAVEWAQKTQNVLLCKKGKYISFIRYIHTKYVSVRGKIVRGRNPSPNIIYFKALYVVFVYSLRHLEPDWLIANGFCNVMMYDMP